MYHERKLGLYPFLASLGIIAILLAGCAPALAQDPVYAPPARIETSVAADMEVDCTPATEEQIDDNDFQNSRFVLMIGNPGGGFFFP